MTLIFTKDQRATRKLEFVQLLYIKLAYSSQNFSKKSRNYRKYGSLDHLLFLFKRQRGEGDPCRKGPLSQTATNAEVRVWVWLGAWIFGL